MESTVTLLIVTLSVAWLVVAGIEGRPVVGETMASKPELKIAWSLTLPPSFIQPERDSVG